MNDHLGTGDEAPVGRWRIWGATALAAAGALIQTLPSVLSGPLAWLVTLMAVVPAGGMVLVHANDRSHRRRRRSRRTVPLPSRPQGGDAPARSLRTQASRDDREGLQITNSGMSVNITVDSASRSVLPILAAVIVLAILVAVVLLAVVLTVARTDRTVEPPPSEPPGDPTFSRVVWQ